MDVDGVVEIARNNPDLVKGVKVIVAPRTVQNLGLKHVEASKRAAREGGVRLMMHIGDIGPKSQTPTPSDVTAEALAMLDAGDLVTHVFTPLTAPRWMKMGSSFRPSWMPKTEACSSTLPTATSTSAGTVPILF